jgi:hypothetical protein
MTPRKISNKKIIDKVSKENISKTVSPEKNIKIIPR